MHQLLAAPYLDDHLVLRPGQDGGFRIGTARFDELIAARDTGRPAPPWLAEQAAAAWGLTLDGPLTPTVLVRDRSPLPYVSASWEINLGCNYDCEHCYLGPKAFAGLSWDDKARLLTTIRDAGVVFLQITGGEPLLDRDFPAAYELAQQLGMMVGLQTNGYLLSRPRVLDVLTAQRPYKIAISVYGASAETYDGLTRTRGAFAQFMAGIEAAADTGLPVKLNIVLAAVNAHERDAMIAIADRLGFPHHVYGRMSPTFYGDGSPLPTQAPPAAGLPARRPFRGCNAGHTFFHADPHGLVSFCKIGRDHQFNLVTDGLDALQALPAIADEAQLRTGGCSGCQLSGTCTTCRPLAKLYQQAGALRITYCQHPDPVPAAS